MQLAEQQGKEAGTEPGAAGGGGGVGEATPSPLPSAVASESEQDSKTADISSPGSILESPSESEGERETTDRQAAVQDTQTAAGSEVKGQEVESEAQSAG